MVALSPKFKVSAAERWKGHLAPVLVDGEVIKAMARSRSVGLHGIAFTNARVFTFNVEVMQRMRVGQWVKADKIRGHGVDTGMLNHKLTINTDEGSVPFGKIAKSEWAFVAEQLQMVQRDGLDPVAAVGLARFELELEVEKRERAEFLEKRARVEVVGDAMKDKQWEKIESYSSEKELPWLVVNNGSNMGYLAAFDDRLVLFRGGMFSSAASGSLTLGGGATFPYEAIITIQHLGKMMDGTLEIVTLKHRSLTETLEPKQKLEDERFKRVNCIAMPSVQYAVWAPHIERIMDKVRMTSRRW